MYPVLFQEGMLWISRFSCSTFETRIELIESYSSTPVNLLESYFSTSFTDSGIMASPHSLQNLLISGFMWLHFIHLILLLLLGEKFYDHILFTSVTDSLQCIINPGIFRVSKVLNCFSVVLKSMSVYSARTVNGCLTGQVPDSSIRISSPQRTCDQVYVYAVRSI